MIDYLISDLIKIIDQSFMENSWNQGLKGIAFGKVSWTLCAGFAFADSSFLASPLGRDVRLAVTRKCVLGPVLIPRAFRLVKVISRSE